MRLPRPVGQATSIVGALVIGDAAVTAGLVSPAMVIVVGLTALASFIIPTVPGSFSIRLLRFPIMFLAASLGLYGVMVALMAILIHLCALRSFGVPYLSPLAPTEAGALKDSFIRAPWWLMLTRPRFLSHQENKRQDQGQKPRTSPVGSRRRKRRALNADSTKISNGQLFLLLITVVAPTAFLYVPAISVASANRGLAFHFGPGDFLWAGGSMGHRQSFFAFSLVRLATSIFPDPGQAPGLSGRAGFLAFLF